MEPWSKQLAGRLDEHELDSAALAGNPLGDPSRRPLWVYVPPGAGDEPMPAIYLIQGMTGQIDMWRNRSAFRPTLLELVDDLRAPARIVFVDAWTSLGGSQFLDSPATGNYHTYLCDEVVPFVDARYPTSARGITGKSSGGYGAMVTPMLRPDLFHGLGTHAGDALFEVCYLPEFSESARALRDHYNGSFDAFWADLRSRPAFSKPADPVLLNTYAMAACYSAGELPFRSTGRSSIATRSRCATSPNACSEGTRREARRRDRRHERHRRSDRPPLPGGGRARCEHRPRW